MLYVVATPIGNLGDMSPRAVEVLKAVALIAAEDTRVTRRLTNYFGITTPLISCHEHNEWTRSSQLVQRMQDERIDIALVTDAGTPAISDPGARLVRKASEAGIEVVAVPGPMAAAAALSVSGFENGEFTFFGFLPRGKKELTDKLRSMAGTVQTAVVYESPHRILPLLKTVAEVFPGLPVSVSSELTKKFEKTLRGSVEEIIAMMDEDAYAGKGEYCAVMDLSGVLAAAEEEPAVSLEAQLFDLLLQGMPLRLAQEALVQAGQKRNAVYAAGLRVRAMLWQDGGDN